MKWLVFLALALVILLQLDFSDARRGRGRTCIGRDRYGRRVRVRCSNRQPSRPKPEPRPSYERPDRRPSYERPDRRPSYERPDRRPSYERPGQRPNRRPGSSNRPGFEELVFPDGKPGGSKRQTKLQSCKTTEGIPGYCQSASYCYFQYDNVRQYQANQCQYRRGVKGICCPNEVIRTPDLPDLQIEIPKKIRLSAQVPQLSLSALNRAAKESKKIVDQQLKLEAELVRKGFFQREQTSESYHQAFFGGPDKTLRKLSRNGLIGLETTIQIAKRYHLLPHQARDALQIFSLFETDIKDVCPKVPRCNRRQKYRTIDGSCNNLRYPLWGRSNTAFTRLVPPAYADGLNELRISVTGDQLAAPRTISVSGASDTDIPHRAYTLIVMQWGQFIDHDLTLTASTRVDTEKGEGLSCCREELRGRNKDIMHPACKPIPIPSDDRFYSQHRQSCINFVRNAASPRAGCTLGHREQTNQLTQYIDGSQVYGSTDEVANHLRAFHGGRLRHEIINNVEYLPYDATNRSEECAARGRIRCFAGGDVRVNEQTGLTVMHMLWLREHNRIAKELEKLNPRWNDEQIYQETRRIIGAEIQHITLNEWTPLILGRKVMQEYNLFLKPSGFRYDYNTKLHPGIVNAFATAAYRFHSLIQGTFKLMNSAGRVTERLMLRDVFNNPESIYRKGAFDEFLLGLTGQQAQSFDQFFSDELTNHLFQEHDHEFGMDLISLNIQRGRDHGIPGYNAYRRICGLPVIRTFRQLNRVLRRGSAKRLQRLYKTVDDIDLFIAGNHERPLPSALLGPTFSCIIGEQTRRHLLGDRFWYENGKMKHSFKLEQLNEIRKVSLASVICQNADTIKDMQPLIFYQPSDWNSRIPCNKIAHVDFRAWKGEKAE